MHIYTYVLFGQGECMGLLQVSEWLPNFVGITSCQKCSFQRAGRANTENAEKYASSTHKEPANGSNRGFSLAATIAFCLRYDAIDTRNVFACSTNLDAVRCRYPAVEPNECSCAAVVMVRDVWRCRNHKTPHTTPHAHSHSVVIIVY